MSNTQSLLPIKKLWTEFGLDSRDVTLWGKGKIKVSLDALHRCDPRGRLILVSAMTPTMAGEGKTTTSIGLAQGLAKIGERACAVLREPSLGPTFGLKGGATGGGRAVIEPSDDINLHFTGDFHAITSAHNLLAALMDNHLHRRNKLGIDVRRVLWRRVLDMNDRALRDITIGMGGTFNGIPRQSGFDITAASEIMAALCLADDYDDLRRRLGKMIVALTLDGEPVTSEDLKAVGAMLVLLKDALNPNLVQTVEGVPTIVHGGPFANIAHGCNSVVATKLAQRYSDWVVTEAGFGFDLGGEKFFDLKCMSAGLDPAAVVLVATVRALKLHGGSAKDELRRPDPAAVERGLPNLQKHIENVLVFGKTPVVTLNKFADDTGEEIEVVRTVCSQLQIPFAVCDGYAKGGEGAIDFAEIVMRHAEQQTKPFTPLYDWSEPVIQKLDKIATTIYGASSVSWSHQAKKDLELVRACCGEGLPLCVAKTHSSLSDDPKRVGRPEGFEMTVDRVVMAAGAGYIVPIMGNMQRMPGLSMSPQAERMDFRDGVAVGVH